MRPRPTTSVTYAMPGSRRCALLQTDKQRASGPMPRISCPAPGLMQVLQFIEHGFRQSTPPRKSLNERHPLRRPPVFADIGIAPQRLRLRTLDQPLRNIVTVRLELAEQPAAPKGAWLVFIGIAGRNLPARQFAAVIDGEAADGRPPAIMICNKAIRTDSALPSSAASSSAVR